MKLILKTIQPRNPFVAAAVRRVAGAHRKGSSAQRQAQQRELRRELNHPRPSP